MSAPPQADATTGTSRDPDRGGASGHTGSENDSRGRDGGGDLVGTTTGLPPQGETAERTAVEGRTATAQIEVVTETSLNGRGCHDRTLLMFAATAIQLAGRTVAVTSLPESS